jgi:RNA polymerase sigma-70 factor (ECF subfamily)
MPTMNTLRHTEDALLLLRAREGDPDAFTEFVVRWQEQLRSLAWFLTEDQAGADDILQETWIAVLKGLRQLSDVEAYKAWIYRILSHKAADWVRRRQRQRKLRWKSAAERQRLSTQDDRPERIESLEEAVQLLSPPLRHVVLLHYIEEFAVEEVAGILGIPQGTVKSRLHNARKQLRALIEEQDNVEAH